MRMSLQQKIKEAQEVKKALQIKQLVPIEKDDEIIDPDEFEEEKEWDFFDDWNRPEKEIRAQLEIKNQRLQDEMDKFDNNFPIEVFPSFLQEYVLDLEKCLNAPKEYTSAGILVAIAGAIGNKFHAKFKDGWINPPMLYMVLVGATGANKSTPLKLALNPLMEMDKRYSKRFKTDIKEYDKIKPEHKEKTKEPVEGRCLVNDITMEALADVLPNNDVTIYYDEFQGFLNSMNRYRKGDDTEKWLSIWSSMQIRVDRKGKRGTLIEKPFANCTGTIQPDVLLTSLSEYKSINGLYERILYATTPQKISNKWTDKNPDTALSEKYNTIINRIFDVPRRINEEGSTLPVEVKFANEAFECMLNWQHTNTDFSEKTGDRQLVGVYQKLEIYCIRFSLIMAVLDYATKSPQLLKDSNFIILKKHVEAAIRITEYFRNSVKTVFALKPKTVNIKRFDKRFEIFFSRLNKRFTTATALEVGKDVPISSRTVQNYLKSEFFKQYKRGHYEKNYDYQEQ